MVRCSDCGTENKESAKFCRHCGRPLKPMPPSSEGGNKRLLLICGTIIICIAIMAAAFIMISGNDDNNHDGYYNIGDGMNNSSSAVSDNSPSEDASENSSNDDSSNQNSDDDTSSSHSPGTVPKGSDIYIKYCDFYTGSAKSDKTYCSANIGTEHTGESYKISVLYSNDGSTLNDGVSATKTVDEEGFLHIYTSNAFDVYPDKAIVTIYDSNGKFLTEDTFYLQETSGQQKFGH